MQQVTFAQRAAALASSRAKALEDNKVAAIKLCWKKIEEFVMQNAEKGLYSAEMDIGEIFKILPYNLFDSGMAERGLQYLVRAGNIYKIYWK